jgi:hypothetical protein
MLFMSAAATVEIWLGLSFGRHIMELSGVLDSMEDPKSHSCDCVVRRSSRVSLSLGVRVCVRVYIHTRCIHSSI